MTTAVADAPVSTGTTNGQAAPANDWRTSLGEHQANPAFKDFNAPTDLAKAYLSAQDWKGSLPDDLKDSASIKDIKSVPDLVKKLVGAEKLVGAKGIIKPAKDAAPEEWDKYYNAIGRPEKADGYKVPTDNMPEGIALDDTLLEGFKTEVHKLGLTDQQYAALVRYQATMVATQQQAYQQQVEQQQLADKQLLQKEWGPAFEQNMRLAQAGAKFAGGEQLEELLAKHGNDPVLIKALHKIGREISEDEIKGGGHNQSFTKSPADAKMTIGQKTMDAEFIKALTNAQHPGHKAALDEWTKLHQVANPEPAPVT